MKWVARNWFCFVLGIVTVVAFAGSAQAQVEKAAEGSCGSLFGSTICTSYRMHAGKITELILRIPVAMVQQAPADAPMVWPPRPDLNVPFAPAVQQQTGFTYASIYLNPHGHGPATYLVPHFDFHFYFVPERKVEAMDCKDAAKPRMLPAGYAMPDVNVPHLGVLVGSCVPDMGMHALPDADIADKTPWKASMLVGYYDTKPIFFEPMITKALLLQEHSFTLPVSQDVPPTPHVRYPKEFRAVYLPKAKAYDLTFLY